MDENNNSNNNLFRNNQNNILPFQDDFFFGEINDPLNNDFFHEPEHYRNNYLHF